MEPEGSLPHSQMPTTCPYPEPFRSIPYHPHPTSGRSILILSYHLLLGLPSGVFPSAFPTKPHYIPLFSPIWMHNMPGIYLASLGILGPHLELCSVYINVSGLPRNFVPLWGRGACGFNKFSWGQREHGSGGGSPLVRGSGGSCNLVQEISFHKVKFS